jgi:hypothetical protein
MRMIRGIATVSAGSLTALGLALGIGACGVASASVRPAASGATPAVTRTYVLAATNQANECYLVYQPGRFNIMLGGPRLRAQGLHWTSWTSQTATGRGTLVAGDSTVWTVPNVTLHFSHPVTTEMTTNGHNSYVRYFKNLHFTGGNDGINSYWHWSWPQGNYIGRG